MCQHDRFDIQGKCIYCGGVLPLLAEKIKSLIHERTKNQILKAGLEQIEVNWKVSSEEVRATLDKAKMVGARA